MTDTRTDTHNRNTSLLSKGPLRVIVFITLWSFLFTNIFGEFLLERAWAARTPLRESSSVGSREGRSPSLTLRTSFSRPSSSGDTLAIRAIRSELGLKPDEEEEKRILILLVTEAELAELESREPRPVLAQVRGKTVRFTYKDGGWSVDRPEATTSAQTSYGKVKRPHGPRRGKSWLAMAAGFIAFVFVFTGEVDAAQVVHRVVQIAQNAPGALEGAFAAGAAAPAWLIALGIALACVPVLGVVSGSGTGSGDSAESGEQGDASSSESTNSGKTGRSPTKKEITRQKEAKLQAKIRKIENLRDRAIRACREKPQDPTEVTLEDVIVRRDGHKLGRITRITIIEDEDDLGNLTGRTRKVFIVKFVLKGRETQTVVVGEEDMRSGKVIVITPDDSNNLQELIGDNLPDQPSEGRGKSSPTEDIPPDTAEVPSDDDAMPDYDLGAEFGGNLWFMDRLIGRARAYYAKKRGKDVAREASPKQLVEFFLWHTQKEGLSAVERLEWSDIKKIRKTLGPEEQNLKAPEKVSREKDIAVEVLLVDLPEDEHGKGFKERIVEEDGGIKAVNYKRRDGTWVILIPRDHWYEKEEEARRTLRHELIEVTYRERHPNDSWVIAHNYACELEKRPKARVTEYDALFGRHKSVKQNELAADMGETDENEDEDKPKYANDLDKEKPDPEEAKWHQKRKSIKEKVLMELYGAHKSFPGDINTEVQVRIVGIRTSETGTPNAFEVAFRGYAWDGDPKFAKAEIRGKVLLKKKIAHLEVEGKTAEELQDYVGMVLGAIVTSPGVAGESEPTFELLPGKSVRGSLSVSETTKKATPGPPHWPEKPKASKTKGKRRKLERHRESRKKSKKHKEERETGESRPDSPPGAPDRGVGAAAAGEKSSQKEWDILKGKLNEYCSRGIPELNEARLSEFMQFLMERLMQRPEPEMMSLREFLNVNEEGDAKDETPEKIIFAELKDAYLAFLSNTTEIAQTEYTGIESAREVREANRNSTTDIFTIPGASFKHKSPQFSFVKKELEPALSALGERQVNALTVKHYSYDRDIDKRRADLRRILEKNTENLRRSIIEEEKAGEGVAARHLVYVLDEDMRYVNEYLRTIADELADRTTIIQLSALPQVLEAGGYSECLLFDAMFMSAGAGLLEWERYRKGDYKDELRASYAPALQTLLGGIFDLSSLKEAGEDIDLDDPAAVINALLNGRPVRILKDAVCADINSYRDRNRKLVTAV